MKSTTRSGTRAAGWSRESRAARSNRRPHAPPPATADRRTAGARGAGPPSACPPRAPTRRHSNRARSTAPRGRRRVAARAGSPQRSGVVEPVERVGDGHRRHRPVGERDRLGRPRARARRRRSPRASRAAGLRLDGHDVQPTASSARVSFPVPAARSSTRAPAGMRSSAGDRADDRGRVLGSTALVRSATWRNAWTGVQRHGGADSSSNSASASATIVSWSNASCGSASV